MCVVVKFPDTEKKENPKNMLCIYKSNENRARVVVSDIT
jgi:hypothetical protein